MSGSDPVTHSVTHPVMILAGGTGGHVFPALAVAHGLMRRGLPLIWVGTRRGLEARVVPAAGIPIAWLSVSGLRGKGLVAWLLAPYRLALALSQALAILRRYRPSVVLGMGGFVAGPCGLVAGILGTPLVIHEQNAVAGLTNRWLARLSRRVLEGFPGTLTHGLHTGNPVRAAIASLAPPAQRMAGRSKDLRLLVLGGSLGAHVFNELVPRVVSSLQDPERMRVWHQTGRADQASVSAAYQQAGVAATADAFIEDMAVAYSWADVALCRAGALTIAELAAAGIGALLVPYPYAVDDHQTANARYLTEAGAAVLIPQPECTEGRLAELLRGLSGDRGRLLAMAEAARRKARPRADEEVARICLAEGGLGDCSEGTGDQGR